MSADFVAHMEDVLDLYAEPYDPARPVVCFDETSTQLLADARPPIPAKPGRPTREDYEYVREGTRNLFLSLEPLAGWRHVDITERRTKVDFAHQMRWLVEEAYPEAGVGRVVLDNLNTHRKASLYEAFPAEEARRIARKLEFHYTPKHGTWLNMAEIEFSVISRRCPGQRCPEEDSLCRKCTPWSRNAMRPRRSSAGASPPGMPGGNSIGYTPYSQRDWVLGKVPATRLKQVQKRLAHIGRPLVGSQTRATSNRNHSVHPQLNEELKGGTLRAPICFVRPPPRM